MTRMIKKFHMATNLIVLIAIGGFSPAVFADDDSSAEHFTYEYYYKVKWGYLDEWMDLYKKNHYPVLLRLQELGRIVHMEAASPFDHAGEADRWDFRFTIVYPDAATAFEDFDETTILEELYPDQETFKAEEQRRFELLIEHKDMIISTDDLSDW
jgi:hypothetical protein